MFCNFIKSINFVNISIHKNMKHTLMERPLMGSMIRQRVDNEMLCLTDLSRIYEAERVKNGWVEKRLDWFFNNDSEQEYIIELLDLQGCFINVKKLTFMDQVKNQGLVKSLKSIGQYKTGGRGENKAVYCNPYIFVAVAQWLNPKFRAKVTMWVTDQLILNRIEAGANYNTLCDSIKEKILPQSSDNSKKFIFSNFAKLINNHVFGKHDSDLRHIASKEQLTKLRDTEIELTTLINVGFISSYQEAKEYLKNKI